MRRNHISWWRRIFRHLAHVQQEKETRRVMALVSQAPRLINSIVTCENLYGLLFLHKKAWELGFRNRNLDPSAYGFFRTADIATMTADEVYLGGFYGLGTFNIIDWVQKVDCRIGANSFGVNPDKSVYDIIVEEYRCLLYHNIISVYRECVEIMKEHHVEFGDCTFAKLPQQKDSRLIKYQ